MRSVLVLGSHRAHPKVGHRARHHGKVSVASEPSGGPMPLSQKGHQEGEDRFHFTHII
jgi:hypothetical protein